MTWIWLWAVLGWVAAGVWLYYLVRIVAYSWGRKALLELPLPDPQGPLPSVAAVVPARDEGAAIEECLRSLLAQEHADVTVVAVNDRSADDTGAIMDRFAAVDPRLAVEHIAALPSGWLGKNHANWRGARHPVAARRPWILFTDGDIHFEPTALARAIRHAEEQELDLVCVMPDLYPAGYWENAMCLFFGLCYLVKCAPWHLQNPRKPKAFTGLGAFNLVRREVYERFGGHEPLRLEVLDDYKLGRLVKRSGGTIGLLRGAGAIRVRWHVGLRGIVRGLEKNAFAASNYSIVEVLAGLVAFLGVTVLPPVAAILTSGAARWGWLAGALIPAGLLVWFARLQRVSPASALAAPGCALALAWAVGRATWLALRRGGVSWRGTFYPLSELKAGQV